MKQMSKKEEPVARSFFPKQQIVLTLFYPASISYPLNSICAPFNAFIF